MDNKIMCKTSENVLRYLFKIFIGKMKKSNLFLCVLPFQEPIVHGYYYAIGLFVSTFLGAALSAHFSYQVSQRKGWICYLIILYNLCSVPWGYHDKCGGYLEYQRGCSVLWGIS